MRIRGNGHRIYPAGAVAFTLIEVMIAVTIFFMAMFTILGVLSAGLHAASLLRSNGPTAGMVASELSITMATNKCETSSESGDFHDIPVYDGYRYQWFRTEAATNGLEQYDIVVTGPDGKPDSVLTVLFYCPNAKSGLGVH